VCRVFGVMIDLIGTIKIVSVCKTIYAAVVHKTLTHITNSSASNAIFVKCQSVNLGKATITCKQLTDQAGFGGMEIEE
jgi:hypothetical protein